MPSVNAQVLYGSVVGTSWTPATRLCRERKFNHEQDDRSDARDEDRYGRRYSLVNVLPGAYDLKVTGEDSVRPPART